jgi:DNA-directed RNA polymerase subunit RPC12/RpoP
VDERTKQLIREHQAVVQLAAIRKLIETRAIPCPVCGGKGLDYQEPAQDEEEQWVTAFRCHACGHEFHAVCEAMIVKEAEIIKETE